jgi:hypothetical protein
MRGRDEWDANGMFEGGVRGWWPYLWCVAEGPDACKPGLLGVGGGHMVTQNIWKILRGGVCGVCGVRWQLLGGEGWGIVE